MKNKTKRNFRTKAKNFAYSIGNSFFLIGFGIYAIPTITRKIFEKENKGFGKENFEIVFGYISGAGIGALILKDQISSYIDALAYRDYSSLMFPIFTNIISAGYETLRFIRSRFFYRKNKNEFTENELKEIEDLNESYETNRLYETFTSSETNSFTLSKFDSELINKHF
ncbi:MAG: hypothetical protein QXJ96_02760 [Candidatus Aenigmatarchaeota archaeon]|nr:hypothetical protein [Candidatus Aenigmarchaeota archaeon]